MDTSWFDKRFINACQEAGVEPVINGHNQLLLMCPKIPSQEEQDRIVGLIPPNQPYGFIETMKTTTKAAISILLKMFGAESVMFKTSNDHNVDVIVEANPNITSLEPASPMWKQVAAALKLDQFVKTFHISVNGQKALSSDDVAPGELEEGPDEKILASMVRDEVGEDEDETPPHRETKSLVKIKDDRFSEDRPYLPADVGLDVRILLESTSSVEAFLAAI
jgi:hypothetical protein